MSKKVLSVLMASMLVLTLAACGSSAKTGDVASETTVIEEKEVAAASSPKKAADDFTILDVTVDLVDAAVYSIDDNNTEYVITLFRDPAGNTYISMMLVAEDGTGDIICGAYDTSCVTTKPDKKNGVDWTIFKITDVYTNVACTIIFAEGDDGSVAIANEDFSLTMEGEYLTNEDAVTFMGVAASYIE